MDCFCVSKLRLRIWPFLIYTILKVKRVHTQVKSVNSVHAQQSKYSFHILFSGLIWHNSVMFMSFTDFLSPTRVVSLVLGVATSASTSMVTVKIFSERYLQKCFIILCNQILESVKKSIHDTLLCEFILYAERLD